MRMGQYLIGVAIFASLAAIGSWIAFGPGERAFSGSIGFVAGDVGAIVGRIVFGTGAVIAWLGAIAFAVSGTRNLLGRARASRAAKETE
jgi:hypothetical protein